MISGFELPPNICWLTIGTQRVFAVYAASGGLQNGAVLYLFKKGDGAQPESLQRCDLGLPAPGKLFSVFSHERGWKHAAIWDACDPHSFQACLKELNA
jgi:hypothetical protein